jgi:pimeloyl-ACP methyl ester carboxylesterase
MTAAVEVTGITKSFAETGALDGVDLSFPESSILTAGLPRWTHAAYRAGRRTLLQMSVRLVVVRCALVLVAAWLVGGCGGSHEGTSGARTTTTQAFGRPMFDSCVRPGRNTRIVSVAAPGERVAAAALGHTGPAVIIANEQNDDPCRWLALARALTSRGLRALLFDYGVGDEAAEVLALARWLRRDGARRVAVLGGSLGGEVAIHAGASRQAAGVLDAVVSLSAPRSDRRYPDNVPAARRLRLPTLYVSSTDDPVTTFAKETRELHRATSAKVNELLLVEGDDHASALLTGPHRRQVLAAILRCQLNRWSWGYWSIVALLIAATWDMVNKPRL